MWRKRAPISSCAVLLAAAASLLLMGCGGDNGGNNGMAPSALPSVVEGMVIVAPLDVGVVQFRVNQGGSLSGRVDWTDVGCVCQVVEKSSIIRHGDYAAGVARASSWYPTNARRVMAPERSNPKSSSKTAS